jgi:hypothetical protein
MIPKNDEENFIIRLDHCMFSSSWMMRPIIRENVIIQPDNNW